MEELLAHEIYGNGLSDWAVAAFLVVTVFIVSLLVRWVLVRRLPASQPGAELHWPTVLREVVARTWTLFLIIASIYAGTTFLDFPANIHSLIHSAFVIALFIQGALWADRIASAFIAWRLAPLKTKRAMRNALSLIKSAVRLVIWLVAFLLIFENLGFDVTALVAGLGIGGIAVALAAQSVLGDLFSSLAIVLDRPFEVGDFIVFDNQSGTVEKIGVKTTRIRSLTGEQIACSNSDLVKSRIHNYKRMKERRVVTVLGTTYDTPHSKLKRIPGMIKDIVDGQKRARFDRAHFRSFGDSALEFEMVYWILSPDYTTYMDIQQSINFAIFHAFEDEGIAFAFPSRTLYIPGLERATLASASPSPAARAPGAKS